MASKGIREPPGTSSLASEWNRVSKTGIEALRVICPGDVGKCGVLMKGSWSQGFDLQEDSPSNLIRALLSSCNQSEVCFLDLQSRGLEVCIFLESLHPRTAWLSALGSLVWSSGSVLESQGCRAERSFFAFDLATSLPNMLTPPFKKFSVLYLYSKLKQGAPE